MLYIGILSPKISCFEKNRKEMKNVLLLTLDWALLLMIIPTSTSDVVLLVSWHLRLLVLATKTKNKPVPQICLVWAASSIKCSFYLIKFDRTLSLSG